MRSIRRSIWVATFVSLVAAVATGATVNAASKVEYTWTLAALGQGGWIGGPLFEDGSVGGGGALSINNGSVVAIFIPTTWTEPEEDVITICFDVSFRKPFGAPPEHQCVTGPVTGQPVKITLFGAPHIFRITENH